MTYNADELMGKDIVLFPLTKNVFALRIEAIAGERLSFFHSCMKDLESLEPVHGVFMMESSYDMPSCRGKILEGDHGDCICESCGADTISVEKLLICLKMKNMGKVTVR